MTDKSVNMLISIIMPVYNSDRYLSSAIESIIAQTYQEFELILVDDGSSDGSPELCDEYARNNSKIRVIHKKNAGVCSARNRGMDMAKGDYICFIDNDDIYDRQYLKIMAKTVSNHCAEIVKCGRRNIRITPELVETKKADFGFKENREYTIDEFVQDYYEIKQTGCFNSIWNGIYSTEFLRNNNIRFDEKVKHGNEDLIFNYTALEYDPRIYVVKNVLYTHYYRISHSTSTKYYPDQVETRMAAIEIENRFLDKHKCRRNRRLIDFEQMRECFRIASQCKERKERNRETNKICSKLAIREWDKTSDNYKLNSAQKLDWFLFRHELFELYYLYKRMQRYFEG